jgi:ATP-dependent DNA helicase RecG
MTPAWSCNWQPWQRTRFSCGWWWSRRGAKNGAPLSIDSLIALAALREHKRLDAEALAQHIQRDATRARRTLEQLVEAGLAQAHGNTRGRSYTLSAELYRAKGR